MTPQVAAYDELTNIARACGFGRTWSTPEGSHYCFGATDSDSLFPMWLSAHLDEDSEFFVYGRVRTYGLAGCRTDLHDWIGAVWAATCRVLQVSSPWIVDEGGFALDEEIYGRLLFFSQPLGSRYSLGRDREEVVRLFNASHVAAHIVANVWCRSEISKNDDFNYDLEALPSALVSAFPRRSRRTAIHGRRSRRINYYRDACGDVSFTDFTECSAWPGVWQFFTNRDVTKSKPDCVVGESFDAHLIRSGRIRNVVSKEATISLRRLVASANHDRDQPLCVVPCDSHLIVFTPTGLCSKRIDSGAASYAEAFRHLRTQHATNSAFLNRDIQFEWMPHPRPARLEEFVRDILSQMPEVHRVKQSGDSNEPDAGRDLVAEVYSSFLRTISVQAEQSDASASGTARLVVQCKTGGRNIGKSAVMDVRDTVDRHSASGFLLVALPGITRPLLDYIENMHARDLFWIDCWTKPELEAQLRQNPSIALRYQDIVKILEPVVAQ